MSSLPATSTHSSFLIPHSSSRPVFPFTALVGQERMKRALVLNAINPRLGGVLVRGEKGTAKSTAVRALANLLPEIKVVIGCHYGCDPTLCDELCADCRGRAPGGTVLPTAARRVPIVNLPVGATEDRVTGAIDIEEAISKGERRFEPGLLAAANRGILYVDEVNLLNDHLVDILLDAAAMGMNYVEREGISLSHPAQFILVGTMNPEEGDLRPQLLDRFALAVEVQGLPDQPRRAEVVRRRIGFEADPASFVAGWEPEEEAERARILRAQQLMPAVVLDERMLDLITHLCCDFQVDGLRADIVMYKTAVTLAAYAGRGRVTEEDVRDAAELALLHRRRRQPFEQSRVDPEDIERAIREQGSGDGGPGARSQGPGDGDHSRSPEPEKRTCSRPPTPDPQDRVFAAGDPYTVRPLEPPAGRDERPRRPGRRSRTRTRTSGGQYVAAALPGESVHDVALDATLRAAAPRQPARRAANPTGPALQVRRSDLREKVRETRTRNLILFAVDASGSMAARQRMVAAKQAVLSLLVDAYQKRDKIGLIAFRGPRADLLLPPTTSVELAERQLQALPTGGRTPLAHALQLGLLTVQRHRASHPEDVPLLVLVSDGRPNVSLSGGAVGDEARLLAGELRTQGIQAVVVDTESGPVRMGLGRDLSVALGGRYLPIERLRAGDLVTAVRGSD
ncbi:MAG TPA: putative cobaltochelatase [Chloroflexota bacterium]|nr:putative cobaltochelatase [Chloroflexota bacterium]